MRTTISLGIPILFLFTFAFISCKTYKNSEANSIGIIGSADGPTAIYIKVNPNFSYSEKFRYNTELMPFSQRFNIYKLFYKQYRNYKGH